MSKYTTEVRFICETASGLTESKGYNDIDTILTSAISKIFDFNFPIFDETYRSVLEKKILKHYYTREIGEETIGLWKLRLDTKLNEIMPYYNKLYSSELLEFNPLYTTNLTRTSTKDYESNRDMTNSSSMSSETTNNSEASGTSSNASTDLFSDTPQGSLVGVEESTYLTEARQTNDSASSTSNASNTANGSVSSSGTGNDDLTSTEDYLETVSGFSGGSASELLEKYRKTFLNIDMRVIEELEPLFMQLW